MKWFTSDTHAFHGNIAKGTSTWKSGCRDFENDVYMTEHIAYVFNSYVNENDELYHLGDWSFGGIQNIEKFRNMLNVKTIHLIYGNHDHHIENNKLNVQRFFTSVNYYKRISINKKQIVMSHYPFEIWHGSHQGFLHIHGHCHNNLLTRGKRLDVGIDSAFEKLGEYRPFSIEEIIRYTDNPIYFGDHHNETTNT